MPANPQSDSEPSPGLDLDALRERLREARAKRGACPPWEELRADLLPGGGGRPGREERAAHRELCPYCDAHVLEWQASADRTADTIEAVERHVARGVVEGARRLIALGSRGEGGPSAEADAPAAPSPSLDATPPAPPPVPDWNAPPPTFAQRERTPLDAPPPSVVPPRRSPAPPRPPIPTAPPPRSSIPTAPPPSMAPREPSMVPPRPRPAAVPPLPTPPARAATSGPAAPAQLRLLVVEASAPERIPPSVFLCAQVLGAEVAHVARVDELAGDPDLDAVCAIVFAGARPAAEWPEALRRGRDLAPGRPVVILAGGGAIPTGGARRALGSALLSLDDPAELLLVALDPRLR